MRLHLVAAAAVLTVVTAGACYRLAGIEPCSSTSDCHDDRVCDEGFCVVSGEGEGDIVVGEGEGEGDVVGEGEGDTVGEGEGDIVVGEGEGDVVVGEGEGDIVVGEGEGEGEGEACLATVIRPIDGALNATGGASATSTGDTVTLQLRGNSPNATFRVDGDWTNKVVEFAFTRTNLSRLPEIFRVSVGSTELTLQGNDAINLGGGVPASAPGGATAFRVQLRFTALVEAKVFASSSGSAETSVVLTPVGANFLKSDALVFGLFGQSNDDASIDIVDIRVFDACRVPSDFL